jgi:hypothetical protein
MGLKADAGVGTGQAADTQGDASIPVRGHGARLVDRQDRERQQQDRAGDPRRSRQRRDEVSRSNSDDLGPAKESTLSRYPRAGRAIGR